jgi:hypothetical protein
MECASCLVCTWSTESESNHALIGTFFRIYSSRKERYTERVNARSLASVPCLPLEYCIKVIAVVLLSIGIAIIVVLIHWMVNDSVSACRFKPNSIFPYCAARRDSAPEAALTFQSWYTSIDRGNHRWPFVPPKIASTQVAH